MALTPDMEEHKAIVGNVSGGSNEIVVIPRREIINITDMSEKKTCVVSLDCFTFNQNKCMCYIRVGFLRPMMSDVHVNDINNIRFSTL